MAPDPQELVVCAGTSFLRLAAQANVRLVGGSSSRKDYVLAFLRSLSDSATLTDSEKAFRVRVVLDAHRGLPRADLAELAREASRFSPGLKNAVAAALPIEVRAEVYGRPSAFGPTGIGIGSTDIDVPVEVRRVSERFSDVLLLSPAATQEANSNLLAKAGFTPLRIENLVGLEEMLRSAEVCAIAVDGSFWAGCAPTEAARAVRLIAAYSTFAWLRIDDSNLEFSPAAVEAMILEEQCRTGNLGPSQLYFRSDGRLSQSELVSVRDAREGLRGASQSAFLPGEISDDEADLLWASLRCHARRKLFLNRAAISSVRTTFLRGGMTNARVAVVLTTDRLLPVVVKIDAKDLIKEEARRFFRFIAPRDLLLRPEVHFHGECALLLFGLVGDVGDDSNPAPQLEVRLRDLWYLQLYGTLAKRDPPTVSDLKLGIRNAVSKLGKLNRNRFSGEPIANFSAPHVTPIGALEQHGIEWGFDEASGDARRRAESLYKNHENSAIVHGDVQLRNILLRADREAFLIDYAGSGPGHPGIDLVRLELSLFLGAFRQITPWNEVVELQRDLSLGQLAGEGLLSKYKAVLGLDLNKVCLDGCLAARNEALAVLSEYGAGLNDYLAVKYFLAWQSLQIPDLQQGLARAVIDAITPALAVVPQ